MDSKRQVACIVSSHANDAISGNDAEAAIKRQAFMTLKAIQNKCVKFKPGDYVDRDWYVRGDPRVFCEGEDAQKEDAQREATQHENVQHEDAKYKDAQPENERTEDAQSQEAQNQDGVPCKLEAAKNRKLPRKITLRCRLKSALREAKKLVETLSRLNEGQHCAQQIEHQEQVVPVVQGSVASMTVETADSFSNENSYGAVETGHPTRHASESKPAAAEATTEVEEGRVAKLVKFFNSGAHIDIAPSDVTPTSSESPASVDVSATEIEPTLNLSILEGGKKEDEEAQKDGKIEGTHAIVSAAVSVVSNGDSDYQTAREYFACEYVVLDSAGIEVVPWGTDAHEAHGAGIGVQHKSEAGIEDPSNAAIESLPENEADNGCFRKRFRFFKASKRALRGQSSKKVPFRKSKGN